jgi:BMFP domain-containing protein YqiC
MKLNETLFEDVSRLASGAAGALSSLREQIEARHPFGKGNAAPGAVSREEFDAVAAMAAKARATQDELLRRIEALEAQIDLRVKGSGS